MNKIMDAFPFLAIVLGCVLIFFLPVLYALFGAWGGLVTGWFFGNAIHEVMTSVFPALTNIALWKIGATLGFVTGFFSKKSFNVKG